MLPFTRYSDRCRRAFLEWRGWQPPQQETVAKGVRLTISLLGAVFAVSCLGTLLDWQIDAVRESPYYGPASLVEESAYTYTTSANFLKYGFVNSGFLQDCSNSSEAADHPFVYNHMPAGPDIVLAVLLRCAGRDYVVVRILLACAYAAGVCVFLIFAQRILDPLKIPGAGFVLLFVWPWILIQGMDRLIYNFFPLLAFSPLVLLSAYYRWHRRFYLALALALAFVSSLYLEYALLTGLFFSWILLWMLQLLPIERRHLVYVLTCFVAGVALHLLQNLVYFGPSLFVQELALTISNRVAGVPSQAELQDFYRSHAIVHHGSHRPEWGTLLAVMRSNLSILPADRAWSLLWIALLGAAAGIRLRFRARGARVFGVTGQGSLTPAVYLARLFVWIGGTVLMPIICFPAFGQEVNLLSSGANYYLAALGAYAVLGLALKQALSGCAGHWRRMRRSAVILRDALPIRIALNVRRRQWTVTLAAPSRADDWRWMGIRRNFAVILPVVWTFVLTTLVALSAKDFVKQMLNQRRAEYAGVRQRFDSEPFAALADLKRFAGELYMTNINTPTVGFFVDSPGYGVCGLNSVGPDGTLSPEAGKVANMRRDYSREAPRYFFFFQSRELFPGFADCLPSGTLIGTDREGDPCMKRMRQRLESNFTRIHENELFCVYDLHQRQGLHQRQAAVADSTKEQRLARRDEEAEFVPCCDSP